MSWERIWGPTELVVVDGETGAVYGKPATQAPVAQDIYRWEGEPEAWTALGMPAKEYVTAGWTPHNALYCLTEAGVVHRHDASSLAWASLGGPDNGMAGHLYGGPDQLLATGTGPSPDVFRWDEQHTSWERIGGPGKTFVVGKSSDPEFKLQVYGQSPDSAPTDVKGIYQWSGGWYKRGGPARDVWISQSTLFATNPVSGDMLSLFPTGWKRIGGPGKMFAADQRGHLVGHSPENAPAESNGVYRWTGVPNQWEKIGGPAGKIFAGWNGLIFATDPDTGDLWHYLPSCPELINLPDFAGVQVTPKLAHVTGKKYLIAILWDPHRPAHPALPKEDIEQVLFGPRPSVRDWLWENSGGKMELVNAGVLGWYDAPPDKQGEHYWDNPYDVAPDPAQRNPLYHHNKYQDGWLSGHTEKWADAIRRAADTFNFAAYDSNQDKTLGSDELAVLVVFPQNKSTGYWRGTAGKEFPASEPLKVQGIGIPAITEWYTGAPPDLGVATHELSHLLLNTPDLYFDGPWPYAAARYSNSDQAAAVHLSAPEKLKLGWLNYQVVTHDDVYALKAVETSNAALILYNPKRGTDEYFLIENRWRGASYDAGGVHIGAGLPMDGIAIWHVIENPAVFDTVTPFPPTGVKGEWGRLGIRLIRANGGTPVADTNALFAKQGSLISDITSPARLTWLDGSPSGFRVKLMTPVGPAVQLKVTKSCP